MKKRFLVLFVLGLGLSSATFAQSSLLSKAESAMSGGSALSMLSGGTSVSSLTKTIVEKALTPKLSLTSAQTPGVTSAVSDFLTKKKSILSLAQTDKSAYTTKQNSLFSSLKTKLAGILLKQQMNKFLGLQSSTSSSSPLSLLFK